MTHDERKAAEAAFRGLPADPGWSRAGRSVYEGLVSVLGKEGKEGTVGGPTPTASTEPAAVPDRRETGAEAASSPPSHLPTETYAPDWERPRTRPISREEAVHAGLLIDVTPQAQDLGLPIPVGITKALWDLAVAPTPDLPEEQQAVRLRDILLALRLRMATVRPQIPLFEFPVLLAFPPETAPQLCSLLALAHEDRTSPQSLTIVLHNEVSAIVTPFTD